MVINMDPTYSQHYNRHSAYRYNHGNPHPEQKANEHFITNHSPDWDYASNERVMSNWKNIRAGNTAYDVWGRVVPGSVPFFGEMVKNQT